MTVEEPKPKSGERVRKKLKVRIKEEIDRRYYIAGGVISLFLVLGIAYAIWRMTGDEKPVEPPPPENKGEKIPNPPKTFVIPTGWSKSSSTLGFTAYWPIKSMSVEVPVENLNPTGSPPNTWQYSDKSAKISWKVEWVLVSDSQRSDPETALQDYCTRRKREGLSSLQISPCKIADLPARHAFAIQLGNQTTFRAVISGNKLWVASVFCTESLKQDNTLITNFLDSFKPE